MTIDEAFSELLQSEEFKAVAKRKDIPDGSRFRQYKLRYKKGTLSKGLMIDLLEAQGYDIAVNISKRKPIGFTTVANDEQIKARIKKNI